MNSQFTSSYVRYNQGNTWTDWNPSFTNLNRGAGITIAKKCQIGKVVYVYLEIELGTGFSFAGGTARFSGFPTMKYNRGGCVWRGQIIQKTTQIGYPLTGYSLVNNLVIMRYNNLFNSNVTYTAFTATGTAPITFAVGDVLMLSASYETI